MARAGDEGRETVRSTSTDVANIEELGKKEITTKKNNPILQLEDVPPSTVYSEALIRWRRHEDLKQKKKEEFKTEIQRIKSECDDWNIDFSKLW